MNELTIIRKENIDLIVSNVPAAYNENTVSHDRCLDAGRAILARMQQGMTDELDQQAAVFIEKARKTVRKMNDKRAPLTKLFDEIRTTFTGMENDIDPAKAGTIPAQIQSLRNNFAAKKREEALARQREEMRLQQERQYRTDFYEQCQNSYRDLFNARLNHRILQLQQQFQALTLHTIDAFSDQLHNTVTQLPGEFVTDAINAVVLHAKIPAPESRQIRVNAMQPLIEDFKRRYTDTLTATRDNLSSLLTSKRQQLQAAAKADAEEAARIEQQMRETDQQLAQQQQQQQAEAEMRSAAKQADDLFSQAAAAAPSYVPKTNVKLRIVPLNAEAFPEILALWWKYEGVRLTVDELSKTFRKQLTFAEKLANDKTLPELIQSEHLTYEEEVKAK